MASRLTDSGPGSRILLLSSAVIGLSLWGIHISMAAPTTILGVARFGPYEVDLRAGELRKFGLRVKLGEQPLRILVLLIEHAGELVSREELRSRLWPENTFVDFDHGLNSAVQRLRDSLADTADKAKWVETVPRRGYRFVGDIEWCKPKGSIESALSVGAILNPTMQAPAILVDPSATRAAKWKWLAIALICTVAGGIMAKMISSARDTKSNSPIRSLAVLPMEDLSGDASQDHFADGMTDELITELAKNPSLRVISRTSVMQFKGVHRPVRDIARELGVDGILEGSVTHAADRVHMTVQLIHAPADTPVWAESYDREFKNAIELPAELAETIAKEIKAAATPPVAPPHINPEAHEAYMQGRFFWFSSNGTPSLSYFQKAVQLQPDYAAAWSGIADSVGGRAVAGSITPAEAKTSWEAAARKAVELDDSLPEAHNSLAAWYLFWAWDWNHAEAEGKRCIALTPNYAEGFHVYSYIMTVLNRPEEALQAQKQGMELDPLARPWALGYTYFHLRRFDDAVKELRLREEARPEDISMHELLSISYQFAGQEQESAREWEQVFLLQGDKTSAAAVEREFQRGGIQGVAEWDWKRTGKELQQGYVSPFWRALQAARAHHKEETLHLLEEAYREHSPRLVFLQNEPVFDFLHSEARYKALVRKVGLPPTY
jgi:TolB-like protein/DNA-binding winged helix-turn-helix (wHTH) protein